MRRALSRFLRRAGKVATRGGSPFFSYGEQMEPPISAEVIHTSPTLHHGHLVPDMHKTMMLFSFIKRKKATGN